MNIRPFGWRDLPLLHSYRQQGIFLDSKRVLIDGPDLIPIGAILNFLGPTIRIFTYRCTGSRSSQPVIAQLVYDVGAAYARLSFLAPEKSIELADFSALSDYIAAQMGSQGAFHILADMDEENPLYPYLRRVGFAIYARQRIWRLDGLAAGESKPISWRACHSRDVIGIRSLYCNVVPGLVQQVEPLPKKNLKGVVYYQDGDLRAYVELVYGRNGIWVQPFVHPDAVGFDRHLTYLLQNLPARRNRPLFICVRSYQSWLEIAVEAIGAQPGPQQAVMVRHLVLAERVKQGYTLPAINGNRVEPTAPIAHIEDPQFIELSDVETHPSTGSAS